MVAIPQPPACVSKAERVGLVVVAQVHHERQPQLFIVVEAGGLTRLLARPRKHGEQYRRQQRDNRDDYQQFNQRKTLTISHNRLLFLWIASC
jgi:hypothetical protein